LAITVNRFEQALRFAHETSYGLSACASSNGLRAVMHLSRGLSVGEPCARRACDEIVQGFHSTLNTVSTDTCGN
jgi:lactaldehyde dehydrogenase/glycolaldehyde dehydrogenase